MRSRLAKWPQEGDLARTAPAPTSKHLKHVIGRPGCRARPARNTANAVHPRVFVRAGLKVWRGPKIVEAGIDGFASIEAIDHVLGAVAESLVSHIDHLLVVRLERKSDVKLQHAVTSQQEPIAAARQHLSFEARTLEGAASDLRDPPSTIRRHKALTQPLSYAMCARYTVL